MQLRAFEAGDRAAVVDLWHRVGLTRPWNDPDRDLDRKVADSPWGLLVGEDGGTVIAAVMVGYDGHEVIAFHERRGYVLEPATHAVNLGRRLIADGPHAGSPVGSGAGDAAEGA